MSNENILIKLSNIIDKLEENGLYSEADKLHSEFLKVAGNDDNFLSLIGQAASQLSSDDQKQKEKEEYTEEESDTDKDQKKKKPFQKGILPGLLGLGKKPGTDLVNKTTEEAAKGGVFKKFKPGLKGSLKFGLLDTIMNMGVDFAVDVFEDAQGPYQMYKNHMPDIEKILNKINELVKNDEVSSMSNQLMGFLRQTGKELETAKQQLKVAHNVRFRTIYNNKTASTKLAIRGEFESEAPKYLRDLVQGAAVGGLAGSLVGGIGAIPGALFGAGSKVLGRGVEDIWYGTISDTGKAYFQGKDLEQKITRLANTFEELNPDLSFKMNELVDKLLSKLEDLNLKNPRKSYLENVIRHLEKKTLKPIGLSK